MFICPYYFASYFRSPASTSFIRILHASPNTPMVDVYINNHPTFKNIDYKKFTDYISVPTGTYNIKVFPVGSKTKPIIDTNLFIPGGIIYTITVTGSLPNISLFPILDVRRPLIQDKTFIRFIHLSPNTSNLDITTPDGKTLFRDINYKKVTKYIPVNPGKYTIEARISSSGEKVLSVPNINLKPNRFYSIYAVGYADKAPSLQLLIPLDGNTYLKFI